MPDEIEIALSDAASTHEAGENMDIHKPKAVEAARETQSAELRLGALLLRLLIGSLFIAHLYWKFSLLPGGVEAWWGGLVKSGYPAFVPAYVLSAEFAGALLLIPGVLSRYVAVYAIPMMFGAAEFWLVRKGFYFTKAGAELPLVWLALLCLQVVLGDGSYALVRSPDWCFFARRQRAPARAN